MSAVHDAIAKRFPAPEWATAFEVPNDAGFGRTRTADAVAMNTWPSRGLAIHGFEVKVSRSDWLRELKDPAKSSAIQRFCDHWWIAVSQEAIVKPGELPPTWGLLVLRGSGLVQVTPAPKLDAVAPTKGFVAAMLRSHLANSVPKQVFESRVDAAVAEREKTELSRRRFGPDQHKALTDKIIELSKTISNFEQASGVQLGHYGEDAARIGHAVRLVMGPRRFHEDPIARALGAAQDAVATLQAAQKELETLRSASPGKQPEEA